MKYDTAIAWNVNLNISAILSTMGLWFGYLDWEELVNDVIRINTQFIKFVLHGKWEG